MSGKPKLKDRSVGVDIRLPDGSFLPQKRRKGSKRKPLVTLSQMSHTVEVGIGDGAGNDMTVDMPITPEGALMACYGMACAMSKTAEVWIVKIMNEMEKNNELPNTQEMKDMMGVVKNCQDLLTGTWRKIHTHDNTKDGSKNIHAPMLNQFFQVHNIIQSKDGKEPSVEDIFKRMHDLKITQGDSLKVLGDQDKEAKVLSDSMHDSIEVNFEELLEEEENENA